jgi:hypothetical protein
MPVINSPRPFFLLFSNGERIPIVAGVQTVTAEIASHPYVIAMCDVLPAAADDAPAPVETPADVPPMQAAPTDDRNALATQATGLGIKVDGRWSLARLKAEIAAKVALSTEDLDDDKVAAGALAAIKATEGDDAADDAAAPVETPVEAEQAAS